MSDKRVIPVKHRHGAAKVYKAAQHMDWNPLLKFPRNLPCFCNKTQLKAKNCCLPKIHVAIDKREHAKLDVFVQQMREMQAKARGDK